MSAAATLPRNTTRQAEAMMYGNVTRVLHRVSGSVIVVFVLVHVMVQAILHVPSFAGVKAGNAWLETITHQHWIHAILWFSIVFHTLHGLRLLAADLGHNTDYRTSLWVMTGISGGFALREVLRYVGI